MKKFLTTVAVLVSLTGCVTKEPVKPQVLQAPEPIQYAEVICINNEASATQHTLRMDDPSGTTMYFDGIKYTMLTQGIIQEGFAVVMYQNTENPEIVAILTPGEGVWYMHYPNLNSDRDEFGMCKAR